MKMNNEKSRVGIIFIGAGIVSVIIYHLLEIGVIG